MWRRSGRMHLDSDIGERIDLINLRNSQFFKTRNSNIETPNKSK